MPEDIDKINEIFGSADKSLNSSGKKPSSSNKRKNSHWSADKLSKKVDRLLLNEEASDYNEVNYTGDDISERDFRPVRQSHESSTGCLGGIMYFVFVLCLSVILACVTWMSVSDVLALNQEDFSAEIALPTSIFSSETVTLKDDGKDAATVTHADIDYVASELKEAGLVHYKWLFKLFCKISKADTKLDPGSYILKSTYDYRAIIKHMQSGAGNTLTVTVTIPEGFTMEQIFRRLEENKVSTYDELMDAAANASYNYDFIAEPTGDNASRLEGYLFPDTYEFYVNMQASSAINKLIDNFYRKVTEEMLSASPVKNRTEADIIKVASLIEKEAANDEERSVIASVIYNRLAAGMTVGLESSILYLHQDHVGAPDSAMINEDSPYNLLKNLGLPPTPICNPGMTSIEAALNPSNTGYYYFTLDTETGTHKFFTNADDFNAFVATQDYG